MPGGQAEPGSLTLARLAEQWAPFGPPIVLFNKSHSGSRLLARLMLAAGVFLGDERNESEDAAGMMALVRPLVERHYPDYAKLMRQGDPELEPTVNTVLSQLLRGHEAGRRWGWKLCESLYVLPILQRIFPKAHFVHLLRDGRDVAFSDHVAPAEAFWRKVYFDTAEITVWNGRRLDDRSYRRSPHVFNARHWVNSVSVARHYGAMLGDRYLEVRFEDLVLAPHETAREILSSLGVAAQDSTIEVFARSVDRRAVGKFRGMPWRQRKEAEAVLRPTLEAFGYGLEEATLRGGWLRRR